VRSGKRLAARVKRAGQAFIAEQRKLLLLVEEEAGAETPYQRLLADAMSGAGALFAREDAVEAAWAVVDPVLENHPPVHLYPPGSWGPPQGDALIAADGGWHKPAAAR
jgi:glucose-6-phosphate 1-dehydrogenase